MSKYPIISTIPLLMSLAACGGGDDARATFGATAASSITSAGTTLETSDTNDSNTTEPADTSTTDATDTATTGLKFDTLDNDQSQGSADDGGGQVGCKAIDFLFVIDNSGSMGDNQANLIASFPGFISKIQEVINDVDSYHIMVVKTDELWNGCQVECAFFPFLCQFGNVNACNGAPTVCDDQMGAGVNFPIGDGASNMYCNLTGGQRYITPQEPIPALPQRFTCIASVGTDGDSNEQPMAAMTEAVGPVHNGPGGCNSGFLRDDAILVITIITDEDDNSPGTPAGWYQNIIAQKGGDGSGVVVLGLINDENGVCPVESQYQTKIREFMDMFPNHFEGSVCAPNYVPFFEEATNVIDTACDEYVPIG